jgi:hypothetical protein
MEIATVLQVHHDPVNIIDTVESIFTYSTRNVLLLINGSAWEDLKDIDLQVSKVKGFRHDVPKAPYRNMALSLQMAYENWPKADWFCYTEYDALFASDRFKHNLRMAEERDVWMLGNCGHIDHLEIPLLESLVGEKFKSVYYLLGCCQFFHRNFMEKLNEINFFERFLFLTNSFSDGYFPAYSGYDISEHMYPTLCRHFGGNIGVFATWDEMKKEWHGASEYFPMRWQPELNPDTEMFPNASILHPLKTYDHPVREFHRERRKQWTIM